MKHRFIFSIISLLASISGFAQEKSIDSLRSILGNQTGKERAKTLIELCWEYRFTNADTARLFGNEALELAKSMKIEELEVEAINNIGVTHEAQGNYAQALELELKALELRRKIGDDSKTAKTLNDIGIVYDEQGNYQKALEYYFEARKIFERLQDFPKIAMVINNIGIVLKAQKEFKKVVGYYQQALAIYQKLGNKFGVAACHANLGSVYFNLNRYDSALVYSQLAATELEAINNKQFLAAAICNVGMALHKLKRLDEATKSLLQAEQLYIEYDNKRELAFALIYLAGIDRESNRISQGIARAKEGLSIAEKINAKEQVMQAQMELAELYASSQNFQQSLDHYRKYNSVKDSLYETEKSRQMAELQTRFETEKKENQIVVLRQENELKDSKIRQNRLLILSLIGILMGGLALGLLYRTRARLKQQAELAATRAALRESQLQAVIASQEEERKRFAADLHDGLGQMISAVRLGLSKDALDKGIVQHSLSLLNEMNQEIRNIAFNLMPQVLVNGGLEEALKEFASRLMRSGGIAIQVQTFDLAKNMPSEQRVALYRISQEWVNNVIKYSGATSISIQVVQHPKELVLTIEDNGRGFNSERLLQSEGNGWKNINSRLHLIKGELEIDSQEGRTGTTLIITVANGQ
ncbi:MAG: tetratricopeptide repeat protein [Cyclobacteriaceae bacterium]|nr:tetratricopeptide repeat protein [Cyclobacteriaceae bacterium]